MHTKLYTMWVGLYLVFTQVEAGGLVWSGSSRAVLGLQKQPAVDQASGSFTTNREPSPGTEVTLMPPPWAWAIC